MLPDIEAIERATLAAVPPQALQEHAGWLLALDDGTVGRAHSAVPLLHEAPPPGWLDPIEACYAAHGLPTVLRLPRVAAFEAARGLLAQRGYAPARPTQVQTGDVARLAALVDDTDDAGVQLATTPDAAWASVFLGEGFDAADGASRVRILGRARDALYAQVQADGRTVAVGCGGYSHGWLGVHGMRTLPGWRGRGLASRILAALGRQAQRRGITRALLQVEQGNPAAALYARAGFGTAWVYEYWRRGAA